MAFPVGPFRKVPLGGGAKLSPFFPLSLPHLELYLDSRLGVSSFADGASLTTWPDQSGHSPTRDATHIATFTDPKIWKTTSAQLTPKGKPSVEWGLTTAFPGNILGSSSFAWPDINARGYTFYCLSRVNSKTTPTYPAVNQVYFGATNNISALRPELAFDTGTGPAPGRSLGMIDDSGGGNPHQFSQLSAIAGSWKLHTAIMPLPNNNTVKPRYYVNGVQQTWVAGPAGWQVAVGTRSYTIGGNFSGNVVVKGNTSVYLWYSDIHSQATINLLKLWASIFFGLT